MAENTKIEWAHHTFNPWMGCSKVSEACRHCYAERDMDHRWGKVTWGPHGTRIMTSPANWRKPITWDRDAACLNTFDCNAGDHADCCPQSVRPRVFCASLADVFEDWDGAILRSEHGELCYVWHGPRKYGPDRICSAGEMLVNPFRKTVDGGPVMVDGYRHATMNDVRGQLFRLIDATPNLDWLMLTKRPERILECWPKCEFCSNSGYGILECTGEAVPCPECVRKNGQNRPNVWLGTSVENRDALPRIDALRKCRDLAPVLFLSCEPLLEDLGDIDLTGVDWVIAGGESGPNARPSHPDWFRGLQNQCVAAGVPFLFKQWGKWLPSNNGQWNGIGRRSRFARHTFDSDHQHSFRVGKKAAGRQLDGQTWDQFPKAVAQGSTGC